MTLAEFIQNANSNYTFMKFKYDYFTRSSFFSFNDIENCRRKTFIKPSKKYYVKDNQLIIKCYKVSSNEVLEFKKFMLRDYPKNLETYLELPTGELLELTDCGYREQDCWIYDLEYID